MAALVVGSGSYTGRAGFFLEVMLLPRCSFRLLAGPKCQASRSAWTIKDRYVSNEAQNKRGLLTFCIPFSMVPSTRKANNSQQPRSEEKEEVSIDNIKVEVLRMTECAKYLGQAIKFEQQETKEIKNRLRAAWASFDKFKQQLTSKLHRLCYGLRLFNMVITPTLTHASGNGTLSKEHERLIRWTQRKMLRLIVQTKRKYRKRFKKSNEERKRKMMRSQQMKKMTLEAKTVIKILKVRQKKATVQTQIAIKTATSPL